MTETLQLKGTLIGHSGWVTQIATNPKYPDMILSSSRGKKNKYFAAIVTFNDITKHINFFRQDFDRLAFVARAKLLWGSPKASLWPQPLYQRRRFVFRWKLRSFRIMGQDSSFVGFGSRKVNSSLRGPYQGVI
jgi:hypothetical protein